MAEIVEGSAEMVVEVLDASSIVSVEILIFFTQVSTRL